MQFFDQTGHGYDGVFLVCSSMPASGALGGALPLRDASPSARLRAGLGLESVRQDRAGRSFARRRPATRGPLVRDLRKLRPESELAAPVAATTVRRRPRAESCSSVTQARPRGYGLATQNRCGQASADRSFAARTESEQPDPGSFGLPKRVISGAVRRPEAPRPDHKYRYKILNGQPENRFFRRGKIPPPLNFYK